MDEPKTVNMSIFRRFILAFIAFFAVLGNRTFAGRVQALRQGGPAAALPPHPPREVAQPRTEPAGRPAAALAPAPAPASASAPAPAPRPPDHGPALHVLAILQREGRLIDFLQEDITAYADAEVGAAARTVHEGCRKALADLVTIEPIYAEEEGAAIVLPPGFDAARVRLTGNVVGQPPFSGSLCHRGWQARELRLPARPASADASILAPAEVELP